MATCPRCAEQVQAEAKVCRHCGYNIARGQAGGCLPALLSLVIPGLGQLARGRVLSGVIFFLAAIALWFAWLGWVVNIVAAVAAYQKD